MAGKLTVLGTGLHAGHATTEAIATIASAQRLFAGSSESDWIKNVNSRVQYLGHHRAPDRDRAEAYNGMTEEILNCVRAGENVVACFYGDASIACRPSNRAIRRARLEGFEARMLPAISSINTLFCDLNLDPAERGCAMNCASDYLRDPTRYDVRLDLLLWQLEFVASSTEQFDISKGMTALAHVLGKRYGRQHEVTIYRAPHYREGKFYEAYIREVPIFALPSCTVSGGTLHIPPTKWMAR